MNPLTFPRAMDSNTEKQAKGVRNVRMVKGGMRGEMVWLRYQYTCRSVVDVIV